jgi:hypothetical protein
MSFGGTAGAADDIIDAVAISPVEGATVTGIAGGSVRFLDANGRLVAGGSEPVRSVVLEISGGALAAYVAGPSDGTAADVGRLMSAVPAGGAQGLPVNFGPGRGKWADGDLYRLSVEILSQSHFPLTAGGGFVVVSSAVAAGDLVITFRNFSSVPLSACTVRLRYDHSAIY